jgi:hypothetical protein
MITLSLRIGKHNSDVSSLQQLVSNTCYRPSNKMRGLRFSIWSQYKNINVTSPNIILKLFFFLYKHGRRVPELQYLTTVEAYSDNRTDLENKNIVGRIPVGIWTFVSSSVL